MPVALTCELRTDALPTLTRLRGRHLAYIREHLADILFGGPARSPEGIPEEMIIVLRTDDLDTARNFIDHEPYNASGQVFQRVRIRPWSQVVPETQPGALDDAIAQESDLSSRISEQR